MASGSQASSAQRTVSGRPSLGPPGLLLGLGLGGFVDGIVLHQILQWHHMVSAEYTPDTLANVQVNVTADGFFHAFVWIAVAVGLALLWRVVRTGRPWTWRSLVGWMLAGWGAFNLVEGIIDHHVLQVHRVRPDAANPLAWDLGFLAFGGLLVLVGWLLVRSDRRGSPPEPAGASGR
jgi:uncharacterized membrane protein